MKLSRLTTEELAAVVCDALERRGLTAILTGGACVMIYAEGRYVSRDWTSCWHRRLFSAK